MTSLAIFGGLLVVSLFLAALAALARSSCFAAHEDEPAGALDAIPDGHLWDTPVHGNPAGASHSASERWTWHDDDQLEQLLGRV